MKNLNLAKFNVVELHETESKETNGGFVDWIVLAGAALAIATAEIVSDWANFKRGFNGQPPLAQ